MALPLVPAALALAGFYYAALQLQARLVETAGWLLGVSGAITKATTAIEYLKHRGLDGTTAARFHIGYAADEWDRLKQALAPDGEDSPDADERLDIEAVDDQARRLLGFVLSVSLLGVLLWHVGRRWEGVPLAALWTDRPEIYAEWKALVTQHAVMGKPAHDARIAAAMKVHGISHLLTFNTNDFKRFSDITAVSPTEL